MFSNNELYKYGFLSCSNCKYKQGEDGCNRDSKFCTFEPDNWEQYMNIVINNLKLANKQDTNAKKLVKSHTTTYDRNVDSSYTDLVNDAIWLLNHKQDAYCFSLTQLIDILKYIPNLDATYSEKYNCFLLRIHRNKETKK